MGASSKEAWSILAAKRMYWTKVLSDSSLDLGFWIMNSIFDFFSFWIDFTLSDTLLSTIISLLLLDIPLPDMPPWSLAWDVKLPTFDEFMRGLLVKLERIDLGSALQKWLRLTPYQVDEIRRRLETVEKTIETILGPTVAPSVNETRLRKAIYGETRYDESYYDPIAVRDFLRSTLHAWFQKKGSYEEVKNRMIQAARALNVREELVQDLYLRLRLFDSIKETCLTWDYGWWDRTCWGPEETHSPLEPVVETVDWSGRTVKLEYRSLFDAQAGGWWDESFWDLFFWGPQDIDKRDVYRTWEEYNDTYLSIFRDAMVVNARSRIFVTPPAVANYQTLEERKYPWRSGRTETYAIPYSQRLRIESIVKSMVTKMNPSIDAYHLRLYVSAALELYGRLYNPHRWGNDMYRSMTLDELKSYWISKWSAEGLDPKILEVIWDRVKGLIDRFGEVRIKDRIRFLRYRLGR